MTPAERKLWYAIRAHRLEGLGFRRQAPIGPYIADFFCADLRLIIEVDGGQHADSPRDAVRDAWLEGQGYRTVRVWNGEVMTNLNGVVDLILAVVAEFPGEDRGWGHPPP